MATKSQLLYVLILDQGPVLVFHSIRSTFGPIHMTGLFPRAYHKNTVQSSTQAHTNNGSNKQPQKAGHHRPTRKTPFSKWRFVGGPMMAQHYIGCWHGGFVIFLGIRTSITKKPYSFVIFLGGGGGPDPCPPLDPRMCLSTWAEPVKQ